jgi:hypothetical protein
MRTKTFERVKKKKREKEKNEKETDKFPELKTAWWGIDLKDQDIVEGEGNPKIECHFEQAVDARGTVGTL